MAASLSFDFFAGLARRIAAPRAPARHLAAPAPLSVLETLLYLGLVGGLASALCGVVVHHRTFVVQRVVAEEAERRASPELLGELICEQDRVIGVSIQRVYDVARVEPPPHPRAIPIDQRVLDGALAAAQPAPVESEPRAVPLSHAAHWQPPED